MKSNIDLTRNRMFIREKDLSSASTLFEQNLIIGTRPDGNGLIPTGDKETRKQARELQKCLSDQYCDRCGRRIDRYPWSKVIYLRICKRCSRELDSQLNASIEIPWRTKEYE